MHIISNYVNVYAWITGQIYEMLKEIYFVKLYDNKEKWEIELDTWQKF